MVAPLNIFLSSIGFLPNLQVLDQIDHSFYRITVHAQPAAAWVPCTGCGTPSRRVHGVYWRSLGDVACFGHPTVLLIRVRRFRCSNTACPRRTFAEPLPGVARPRARQTDRLRAVHQTIGLALGGNPGSRHARAMGVPISRTTLGHRVRVGIDMAVAPVTVLGVDDWAWRKGHRYGTILCDLERRRVIDLLPDRSADTLATWLAAHPSITVVVRDRAGAYAEGTARGAPDALQIADRWHLLRNASDALYGVLEHHHRDLRAAARMASAPSEPLGEMSEAPQSVAAEPDAEPERRLRSTERRAQAAQERRDARYAEAVRLRDQGLSTRAVARSLGVERKTVRRWLRAGHAPTWQHADRGTSILNPYQDYLEDRWHAGCRNTAALWRELQERGFPGQYSVVRDWGTRLRRQDPPAEPRGTSDKPVSAKQSEPPTPRRAVRLLAGDPDRLTDDDRRFVQALRERSPSIATAADLITRFCGMVKGKVPDPFDGWLREAKVSALSPFAAGIRRDEDAVRAALSEPWSSGPVEGQVNRLKAIKRAMYGRAGFELLRARVLGHA